MIAQFLFGLIVLALAQARILEEYNVTMRDGCGLWTGVDHPLFDEPAHYVVVRQDMRGTGKSGGKFDAWRQASNDAYDTFEWIAQQEWSNGEIWEMGASADGLATLVVANSDPPIANTGLIGQWVIFASISGHHVMYPQGSERYQLIKKWLQGTVPNQFDRLWAEVHDHESPTDPWWAKIELNWPHNSFPNVDYPAVQWAGWYDIFLWGNLLSYDGYNYHSSAPGAPNAITVDPLGHCQEAAGYFPTNLIAGRSLLPILQALDLFFGTHHAKSSVLPVSFYVMGPNLHKWIPEREIVGNYWTSLPEWPKYTEKVFYMSQDRSMQTTSQSIQATFNYTADPNNPVPTVGGNNLFWACGPLDQRGVEYPARTDVVTFTSPPLTDVLAITGPLTVVIYGSSDQVDTDFAVKLTDVYPEKHGGASRLINDGVVRGRWRNPTWGTPQLLTPNKVYKFTVSLWNTSYVFNKGHQLRVTVSSSNYPRFYPNAGNGLPLNQTGPVYIQHNSLYVGGAYPSRLILPEVQLAQLPKVKVGDIEAEIQAFKDAGVLNSDILTHATAAQLTINKPKLTQMKEAMIASGELVIPREAYGSDEDREILGIE